ncbi:protoglobin domain-containing protein [Natrialbaceae archaeon AArc-T1-2]|uniref:protoglobin domain-containing protein n=1 Tax=Natrialbaceae archaeon AArc-T1-2 TaxID=3053904 RepID=UPI00255A980C|nr:protoglobin domain-containing protein [Natrialbaceae archaeon AArc-T1-2]WIV66823.1 protoglobin domain-containing protein [Natrialbaceae archaeon AArc-T1-2]
MSDEQIPGYTLGDDDVPEAPIDRAAFDRLQQSVMFTDDDEEYLQMAGDVLEPQIDDILEVWYGFVGDHDFLLEYFADADSGEPIEEYLDRVRERFGQWIRDTCDTPYDDDWLDYQFEIGRRHHRMGKNEADDVDAVEHIHMRYLVGFIYPITATIRDFLENSDHSAEEVEKMYHAWFKSVTLQVTLWTYPYVPDEDW